MFYQLRMYIPVYRVREFIRGSLFLRKRQEVGQNNDELGCRPLLTVLLLAANGLYILSINGSARGDDPFLIGFSKALLTFP